jgi:cohesin complex subunit SA-1/2
MALKINSALCDVAANVSKDVSLAQRQRENEEKKGGVGAAYAKRIKDAENRIMEAQERKKTLEAFMEETFDVYVLLVGG